MWRWLQYASSTLFLVTVFSEQAFSWGLKTHLWIAQRILDDIKVDCRVEIHGKRYAVTTRVCDAVKAQPGEFLAGALGPDIYPDLIVGQTTTHPGVEGGWPTDKWLIHLIKSAKTNREIAFAYGYLVHAAGDIFAHTYVNMYAGDIFILGDERAVERRHFVLEKYIDYRLPIGEPDATSMSVPKEFLRDTLIFNDEVAGQNLKARFGTHLVGMFAVRRSVVEAVEILDKMNFDVAGALSKALADSLNLSVKLASGEQELETAREGLRLNRSRLDFQKRAMAGAKAELDDVLEMMANETKNLASASTRILQYREATDLAKEAVEKLASEHKKLESQLLDFEGRLRNTPTDIVARECSNVTKQVCKSISLGGLNPITKLICENVTSEACEDVTKVNDAWKKLNDQVNGVRKEITKLPGIATQTAKLAESLTAEIAAAQEELQRELALATLSATKTSLQLAYDRNVELVKVEEKATDEALAAVTKLGAELEKFRTNLEDEKALASGIKEILDDTNLLRFHFENWRKGIDQAGAEYIQTGLEFSKKMIAGESGLLRLYSTWLSCHGVAFTPVPYQVGEIRCRAESEYEKAKRELDKLVNALLPEPIRRIREEIAKLKGKVEGEITNAVERAAIELIKFVTDKTTSDFVALLIHPENATEEKLNEVFSQVGDAAGKRLLVFEKISSMINSDIGLTGANLDPKKFHALSYSITLGKLAILPPAELNRLVKDIGGAGMPEALVSKDVNFSILFDAVRSIDGNHQWQPFGLPYPRQGAAPEPSDASKRNYGYGPFDGTGKGFQLFINTRLRNAVFSKLFPASMAGSVQRHPQMNRPNYPFPACDKHPFPLTFLPDGKPAAGDDACVR